MTVALLRGAQSGGVVSFTDDGGGGGCGGGALRAGGLRGMRVRVVNGKRTDLSKLVRAKLQRAVAGVRRSPTSHPFFAGHTRFATSSKSSMDGAGSD